MPFVVLVAAILVLILLITWARMNAFIAFLIVCIATGLVQGLTITATTNAVQKGIGDVLGSLAVIISLGAMLGKLIADSGAAIRIASFLIQLFGKKYLQWALALTAFIVGIPLFYGVGFVLLVPLIITIATRYRLSAVYIGLPALAALSVTHGYLPPHPSPVALVQQFHADMGKTLIYGFLIAVPAILLAGPLFAATLKHFNSRPLEAFAARAVPEAQLPGLLTSIAAAFLPVLLIASKALLDAYGGVAHNVFTGFIGVAGDPSMAMLISVLVASYTLGMRRGKSLKDVMNNSAEAVKDVVMILLIIGGAGALKEVLTQSGISTNITQHLSNLHVHPLLLAWSISAIIRVCLGSATIAGLTTAGIVAPLIATTGVNPNLMVLATGAGSLMFSHVNDPGFWMFKEYFNLSFKQTIRTWSVMETIISIVGLIGVFVINHFV